MDILQIVGLIGLSSALVFSLYILIMAAVKKAIEESMPWSVSYDYQKIAEIFATSKKNPTK